MNEAASAVRAGDNPRKPAPPTPISTCSLSARVSRESGRPATWFASGRRPPSPSSKRVRRSGEPGTCSAIPASARIRTCRLSAMLFDRGAMRGRSPMARQFYAISPTPRRNTASIEGSASDKRWSERPGDPRTRAGRWTSEQAAARRCGCRAIFSFCARATTNTRKAICRAGRGWKDSPAASFIRRNGPKTCATQASGWWSSAAARLR